PIPYRPRTAKLWRANVHNAAICGVCPGYGACLASLARSLASASRSRSPRAAPAGPTTVTSIPLAASIADTRADEPITLISKRTSRASMAVRSAPLPSPAVGYGAEAVAVVDVLAELGDAVGGRPGGDIDPVERNRRHQLGVLALAVADHLVDL